MENTLVGVFVIIFVWSRLSSVECTFLRQYGNVQMLQKHPDLKTCTEVVLRENEYVGGRVSERTGECEGLSYAWGLNPSIESGYAYAKKVFVQEIFQPQKQAGAFYIWQVPGVLHTGAKLNMFISIPNPGYWGRRERFELYDTEEYLDPNKTMLIMSLKRSRVTLWASGGQAAYLDVPETFRSKKLIKISWLALEDSVKILVDDKEFTTYQLKAHLKFVRRIGWSRTHGDGLLPAADRTDYLFIDRVQYEDN